MSRDDELIKRTENKLAGKLTALQVEWAIVQLHPAFHSGDSWDEAHCKKMEKLVQDKLGGKKKVRVSVMNDPGADSGGYRVHVAEVGQEGHFTSLV